ncbi:dockerin type I domain-containing protein [Desulfatiglans anilini]|uniref:dockerin type I domain-containing protein n=1 Tax=Desulfatiglans anilini TaxID=90728 RepID=UPI00040E817A|nr:dockerin type I domain-containing protein [Desulfatiglans anilini]
MIRISGVASLLMIMLAMVFAVSLPAHAGEPVEKAASIQTFEDCASYNTDLNGDGAIDVADLLAVKKCIQEGCSDSAYDVDGDGAVNEADADIVLKCIELRRTQRQ